MKRATGFIRDPNGHKWTAFKSFRSSRALTPVDERKRPIQFAAPVSNQLSVGQCVSHGLLDAVYAELIGAGVLVASPYSHRIGYALARAIDRADSIPMDAELPPLRDEGCQPNQLARALRLYGCPLAKDVDGGTLDAVEGFENREINLTESIACQFPPVDFVHVGDSSADKLPQCQAALDDGHPFALAIEAGPKFQGCDGSTVLESDGFMLDHMIHCLDYVAGSFGRRWLVQNSWGPGWGSFGRAWVSDGFVESSGNILIPVVTQ